MNTLCITASPKKHFRWSNSTYVARVACLWSKKASFMRLSGKKDYDSLTQAAKAADVLVLAMPVYVDGIPAHMLEFLQALEAEKSQLKCKVYVTTVCGFYEGNQCDVLANQIECWCDRMGLEYGGTIGVGASEMVGILRLTNLIIPTAIAAIASCIIALCGGGVEQIIKTVCYTIGISALLWLLWSSGMFIRASAFGIGISRRRTLGNTYTTVWFCGRPLFEFFANIFWIVRAIGNKVSPKKMLRRIFPE